MRTKQIIGRKDLFSFYLFKVKYNIPLKIGEFYTIYNLPTDCPKDSEMAEIQVEFSLFRVLLFQLYEKWYNFSDPDLLYNYNVNSQKSKQIIVAGHSGMFGRRLSYFNNTLFNSLPLNNYNDNNFKLYLIYIKNNINCMNNHVNNSISIVSYNWNNKNLNSENSTYIATISESLGQSVGKLYIV